MKKYGVMLIVTLALSLNQLTAALNIGFANFQTCIDQSKHGQKEHETFKALEKQMADALTKTDQELKEIVNKLEDQDYMDSLSQSAEQELKQKFQTLNQDFARYQNQYYQLLNQAKYKMLQTLHQEVSDAAEQVREQKNLLLILNEDSAFAHAPSLDYTDDIVKEMNKQFEQHHSESIAENKQ